ncbi:MAG TPA: CoA protein activase [Bacillota bacterium]|nr:CoA protein activase [Bacillota bacterium]
MKSFLWELGLEPLAPPPISAKTINLGTKYAPEFLCFPFKVNLGNFMEAVGAGAECLLMVGGSGPCRLGYYAQVQREALKEAGFQAEFMVLEAPQTGYRDFWERLKRLVPRRQLPVLWKAWRIFWLKATMLDRFDREANRVRPVEKQRGTVDRLQQQFYRAIDEAGLENRISGITTDFLARLQQLVNPESSVVASIGILGEFYMVLEHRVNFYIEKTLGEMGVAVKRTLYLTDWIRDHLLLSIIRPNWHRQVQKLAWPYLKNGVGGHGLETVAGTVEAGMNRLDGIVHLAPFTCMPEIVAMQVLPAVAKDFGLPVLSIIIDEHSAEAGIRTRLEAFVDLLAYQRQKKQANPVW